MPDAGDFGHDAPRRNPSGWGDAFAAIPQDAPDPAAWQRVQARLGSTAEESQRRWPVWMATAAALLLVAVIPLRMRPEATLDHPTASMHPSAERRSAAVGATPDTLDPGVRRDDGRRVDELAAARDAQPVAPPAARRDAPRVARIDPQRPIGTIAPRAASTRIAAPAAEPADLESLYAQSAQLESLLALARDERVASGSRAALGEELDNRLAAIDATLGQPGLGDAQRADLWRQRVEALQQLAGIEATSRLYAARGESYDAAIVSVD